MKNKVNVFFPREISVQTKQCKEMLWDPPGTTRTALLWDALTKSLVCQSPVVTSPTVPSSMTSTSYQTAFRQEMTLRASFFRQGYGQGKFPYPRALRRPRQLRRAAWEVCTLNEGNLCQLRSWLTTPRHQGISSTMKRVGALRASLSLACLLATGFEEGDP